MPILKWKIGLAPYPKARLSARSGTDGNVVVGQGSPFFLDSPLRVGVENRGKSVEFNSFHALLPFSYGMPINGKQLYSEPRGEST